jgi:hypothetical protein
MSNHDPLRDALRDRADQLGDASPLSLDDVKGRARGIRRRRLAVSALAAAAVVAVAVPAGIAVTGDLGTSPDRAPVAGPSGTPSPSPTRSTSQGPVEVTLTTDVDATSYEPGIPFIVDGRIVRPDGTEVRVDADYQQLAPLGDGWAALRNDEGSYTVDLLDADGKVVSSKPSTGWLAVSEDATVVSYATPEGRLMTVTADSQPMPVAPREALPGGQLAPRAVVGSGSCVKNAANGGCMVFFDRMDSGSRAGGYSVDAQGAVHPLLLSVNGLAPDGAVSGLISINEDQGGSCSAVLLPDGDDAWKTCQFTLGQFSSDGKYVIGHPAYQDGLGDNSVAILDARTGDVLAKYTNSEQHPSFINNVVWDTDGTLLATVFESGSWSLMRMTASGELSSVAGDLGNDMDRVPLVLSTRP